jgi:hypothetical protein
MIERELVTKLEPGRYMLTYGDDEVCVYRLPGIMPKPTTTDRTDDPPINGQSDWRLQLLTHRRRCEYERR